MSAASRYRACLSYALGPPGALYVLLKRREDTFAVFHARQALALWIAAAGAPLSWAAAAWLLAWIPLAGPVLGVMLFALLLAVYVGLLAAWLLGILYSLRGQARRIPLLGAWAIPRQTQPPQPPEEGAAEVLEPTAIHDA